MPLKIGQPTAAPPQKNLCKSVLKEKSEFVDWNKGEREEHDRRIEELSNEIKALRMDFNEGMRAFQLRLDVLGARWGIFAEEAFREGVKGVVEKYFGGKVQKWVYDLET